MENPTDAAMAFLASRGLDPKLAAAMGWDGMRARDGAVWLRIPYTKDGKVINRKYRKLAAKEFRNDPDSEHDFLNRDCILNEDTPLVITEGELDCLAVLQAGHKRAVSIPDGWSDKLEDGDGGKFKLFAKNEQILRDNVSQIIVAGDADSTGRSFVKAVANFFEDHDVRYVTWPDGCKDANDTLKQWGPDYVQACIDMAKPVDPKGGLITGFTDLPAQPDRTIWKLGIRELDKIIAFRSREVSVLTGIPGYGKSTFAVWCAHHLVKAHDIRIGLCMFETEPAEIKYQISRLRHTLNDDELARELDRNYRLVHRLDDGSTDHGMHWLKKIIHKLAARDGCNLIIIDPWNELEHQPEPGEQMTYYTNFALMRLRQWAERYDIHIMIVAHPRKMQQGEEPYGYAIDGSAAWANKPGMGYTLHCDPEKNELWIRTWKVRSRQGTGCRPGRVMLSFNEESMSYRVLEGV